MSEFRWTDDQRAAIQSVGRSVLVTAAAGSGKTAVLAERCAFLVCDAPLERRCGIDELLVVTFTEAAADEMRARIRGSIRRRLHDRPNDEYVAMQVALLDTAHISTIHSFCLWVIRRWFDEVGIDPAAAVLSAEEARMLKSETLAAVIAERYAANDAVGQAFKDLVDVYGLGRDTEIARFALSLSDFLDSLPDPEKWLAQARAAFSENGNHPVADAAEALRSELTLQIEHAAQVAAAINDDAAGAVFYCRLLDEHVAQMQEWEREIAGLSTHAEGRQVLTGEGQAKFDCIKQEMAAYSPQARGAPRMPADLSKEKRIAWEAAKAAFTAARDTFNNRIRDAYALFSVAEWRDGLASLMPHAAALIDLVESFRNAYRDLKRRQAVLDFADLEQLAYLALGREHVAEAVQRRFAYVLVDEFQDINRLQAAILHRTARDEDAQRDANLFTVGDVRQSIYRFRSAEPMVFLERLESCRKTPERALAVALRQNFRSRPVILDGVNRLFSNLLRPQVGGIEYPREAWLVPGRSFDDAVTPYPTIDVHLLDRQMAAASDQEDDSAPPPYVDPTDPAEWKAIQREAYVIAQEIQWMRRDGMKLDSGRPVQLSDIAVLLRSPKHTGDVVARFLNQMGIAAYSSTPGTLLDALEVRDVLSLLNVLDNPLQDIPLAAVLRSPVLGNSLSEDDLLRIRLLDREVPFHDVVYAFVTRGDDADLRLRLSSILQRLDRYRQMVRRRPFAEALWDILTGSGYLAYVGGLRDGQRRRANLLRLHDLARQFDTFTRQGLFRFLRFLETLQQEGEDVGASPAVGESADAVRIMSVHAAKGLEFPIVFLADLGRRFNLDDVRGRIIFDRQRGIGMNVIDRERMIEYPSLAHRLVTASSETATRAEELRILYVAMTRAMERLVLVGSLPSSSLARLQPGNRLAEPLSTLGVTTASCPLDWLIPALASLPEEDVDWHATGNGPNLFRVHTHDTPAMANWSIKPRQDDDATPLLEATAALHKLPENEPRGRHLEHAARVLGRVRFDYPYLAASSVRAVMAASEVKRTYDVLRDPDQQPRRAPRRGRATPDRAATASEREAARLRGTATHKVLQQLDFAAGDEPAVRIELHRLIDAGILTAEEVERADVDAVSWFVGTPLAGAIREAGDAYRREFMFLAGHPARTFDETLGPEVDQRVLVRGIVDGILPRGDGVEVIEFKTDRIDKSGVPEAAREYRPQVRLYASSIVPVFRRPVTRSWLVFLHPREIVEINDPS